MSTLLNARFCINAEEVRRKQISNVNLSGLLNWCIIANLTVIVIACHGIAWCRYGMLDSLYHKKMLITKLSPQQSRLITDFK